MRIDDEKPGAEAMRDINERMKYLLDQAPSDATAELEVCRGKRGYQGYLKVFSRQRRFVGGCKSGRFVEMIDRVFSEVLEQIDQWKSERGGAIGESTK